MLYIQNFNTSLKHVKLYVNRYIGYIKQKNLTAETQAKSHYEKTELLSSKLLVNFIVTVNSSF